MTDKQFYFLAQYEKQLRCAYYSHFLVNAPVSAVAEMAEIHKELTNQEQLMNTRCASCMLNLFTRVGKLYFEEKERREVSKIKTAVSKIKKGGKNAEKRNKES